MASQCEVVPIAPLATYGVTALATHAGRTEVTPPSQDCRVPVRQRRHLPSRTQWWRPHDGFVAEGRAAYAAPLADRFCLDGGDRDGDRQALHQPGGGPADDHAWRAVGRRFHRFRRRVGTCRSASAHAGGSVDYRQLQNHPRHGVRRRAAGNGFHRQGVA